MATTTITAFTVAAVDQALTEWTWTTGSKAYASAYVHGQRVVGPVPVSGGTRTLLVPLDISEVFEARIIESDDADPVAFDGIPLDLYPTTLWTKPASDTATEYRVEYTTDAGATWTDLITVEANASTYHFTADSPEEMALAGGGWVWFRVTGYDATSGAETSSDVAPVYVYNYKPAPALLALSGSGTKFTLTITP